MAIQFLATYPAKVTERWSVEPPPNWDAMTETERRAWLGKNLIVAELRSQEIEDEGERIILDSWERPPSTKSSSV